MQVLSQNVVMIIVDRKRSDFIIIIINHGHILHAKIAGARPLLDTQLVMRLVLVCDHQVAAHRLNGLISLPLHLHRETPGGITETTVRSRPHGYVHNCVSDRDLTIAV